MPVDHVAIRRPVPLGPPASRVGQMTLAAATCRSIVTASPSGARPTPSSRTARIVRLAPRGNRYGRLVEAALLTVAAMSVALLPRGMPVAPIALPGVVGRHWLRGQSPMLQQEPRWRPRQELRSRDTEAS